MPVSAQANSANPKSPKLPVYSGPSGGDANNWEDGMGLGVESIPTALSICCWAVAMALRYDLVVVVHLMANFLPFFTRMPSAPTVQPAASSSDLALSGL